jgi:hypothetical protein
MEKEGIINFIEKNPIKKLSKDYDNKFLLKIKSSFSEEEQNLFITLYYYELEYNPVSDFIIDLDDIWIWLGFSTKFNAKIVLEKNFNLNKDYIFKLNENKERKNIRGGHNKNTILLTIKTFKLLCLKADTKKSSEIHEYYFRMEKVMKDIIQEESNELKQQLEFIKNEFNEKEEQNKKNIHKKIEKEREQMLLREFGKSGYVIYIIKIKSYNENQYIIKIGESRKGIQQRYNEHKSNYGSDILLLDCFFIKKNKEFETFLHNHNDIKLNKVTNLERHENERELFLIDENLTYKNILNIINTNIKFFNEYTEEDFNKLKMENDMLKEMIEISKNKKEEKIYIENKTDQTILQELLNSHKELIKKIENMKS